jgi:hypothetical protein
VARRGREESSNELNGIDFILHSEKIGCMNAVGS